MGVSVSEDLIRGIDEGFRKLLNIVGITQAQTSTFKISSALGLIQEAPSVLYVSTSGVDTNIGSESQPFRTIQAAIDSIGNKVIKSKVSIQVGAGTFDAFALDGSMFSTSGISTVIGPAQTSSGIEIVGTWVVPTLTTGTTSGTMTGALVDGAAVYTDPSQTWTVNNLKGKYLLVNSLYYPIISNTATTVTIATTTVSGTSYSVWEHGTIIDNTVAYIDNGGGTLTARIVVANVDGPINSFIEIKAMKVNASNMTSGNVAITTRNASCVFSNITVERTAGPAIGSYALHGLPSNIGLSRCVIIHPASSSGMISSATPIARLNVVGCFFTGGTNQLATGVGASHYTISSTTFDSAAASGLQISGENGVLLSPGCRFINCATGVLMTSARAGSLFTTPSLFFSGCTNCVTATTTTLIMLGNCSGTGNTNGIVITKGGRVQIGSTATLGATTEISVDGVTSTLATMRGNSPKIFPLTPNPYGTYVYE